MRTTVRTCALDRSRIRNHFGATRADTGQRDGRSCRPGTNWIRRDRRNRHRQRRCRRTTRPPRERGADRSGDWNAARDVDRRCGRVRVHESAGRSLHGGRQQAALSRRRRRRAPPRPPGHGDRARRRAEAIGYRHPVASGRIDRGNGLHGGRAAGHENLGRSASAQHRRSDPRGHPGRRAGADGRSRPVPILRTRPGRVFRDQHGRSRQLPTVV